MKIVKPTYLVAELAGGVNMNIQSYAQLILVSVCLLLKSCSSYTSGITESTPSTENIWDFVWVLESYDDNNQVLTMATQGVDFTFRFHLSSDQLVIGFSGYDGCNSFGADVMSTEPGHLKVIDSVNQDGAFCDELQYSNYLIQRDYFYSIFESFSFEYNLDDRMRLRTPDDKLLVFKRCGPLEIQEIDQECLA